MLVVNSCRAALLTALVLVLAACSNDESSGPATADVRDPTTVTETDAPQTTQPAATSTTEPPTSSTTTSIQPTTTTTAPTGPQEPTGRPVAVFATSPGSVDRGWVPVGGWSGSDFVEADAHNAPQWTQGGGIRVSTLGERPIGSSIGSDRRSCSGEEGPRIQVPIEPLAPAGSGFGAVAVGGSWALRPYPVLSVDARVARYVTAARELLQGRVPRAAAGELVQIVLTDLDGDDAETSLVVFESTGSARAGSTVFSVLFHVDTATGEATEIDSDVVRVRQPTRPRGTAVTAGSLERFRVLDVLDLNDDRVMEVVTRSWNDDLIRVDIHEADGTSLERVSRTTCDR